MGPVGKLMALDRIEEGFIAWFGNGAFLWVVYVFMLILSIVFITVPLVSGVLAVYGKAIQVGKGGIKIGVLPIIEKQQKAAAQEEKVEEVAEPEPVEEEKTEE